MPSTKEILDKYSRRLDGDLDPNAPIDSVSSDEFEQFKREMTPSLSRYERWARSLGSLIKIRLAEKDRAKVQAFLDTARLNVTAAEAMTLSVLSMLGIFFATLGIATAIFLITGEPPLLFGFLGLLVSIFVFYYTYSMPERLAKLWKLQAAAQMVPAILYTVVYMKHTSNLERAVQFTSQHLEGPLALDFKKIFYDVEVGRYSTIKQALDNYLESWRDAAPEFVESFHLVESSLFEASEARRIIVLEKALQVILDGVYEKMLKYTRSIRSPLTNVYMLGIILPTLGLALLPLASTLLGGILQWYHVFIMFNVLIPFFVLYIVGEIMLKRPGGYGSSEILELNPDFHTFKDNRPWIIAGMVAIPLLFIGLIPFLFQVDFITSSLGLQSDYLFGELGFPILQDIKIFDFKEVNGNMVGPFGPLAVLLSLFIPLSIGVFFSMAYSRKTKFMMKSRNDTRAIETEFTNSIFQLGNRLGDGTPAELAFGKVANQTRNQKTHDFFALVDQNIRQGGMSLDRAIFDHQRGAIIFYPSHLISTAMRIMVESSKKGLQVAARSLMAIADYVKNINKINQRLRDLLAEIITDMKSNMTFLAPLLAGIVVGLASMITIILNKLETLQAGLGGGDGAFGSLGSISSIFNVTEMIPPYFLQASVGLYIVEIIFILTTALVTVEAGKDILLEKHELAKNLKRGLFLYILTALFSITALTLLASLALGGLGG